MLSKALLSSALCILLLFVVSLAEKKRPATRPRAIHPTSLELRGEILFAAGFTPEQGLGPLFNKTSCIDCHTGKGNMGPDGLGTVTRVGRMTPSCFDPMIGTGGPVARMRSVSEFRLPCDLNTGIPQTANITSVRNAPTLHGLGLIDEIPDEQIAAGAIPRGDGVFGRPNWLTTAGSKRIGRFGWKADTPTLEEFVGIAFRNEMGITNPLAPSDLVAKRRPVCVGESTDIEDDGSIVQAVTAYIRSLQPSRSKSRPNGSSLFTSIGCAACHTPSLSNGSRRVLLYSDLLLHNLGSD